MFTLTLGKVLDKVPNDVIVIGMNASDSGCTVIPGSRWVHHKDYSARFPVGDLKYVEHDGALENMLICSGCGSAAPDFAMDLVAWGWRPSINFDLVFHGEPCDSLRSLPDTVMRLKRDDKCDPPSVGILIEPHTGAHPFLIRQAHFDSDDWDRLLKVEQLSDCYPDKDAIAS